MRLTVVQGRSFGHSWSARFLVQRECVLWCATSLAFGVCVCFFGGCSHSESRPTIAAGVSHGVAGKLKDKDTAFQRRGENTLVIEHGLGILKPGERVEHRFVIENDTGERWTFKKVINSCSCTACDLSTPVIEPGKEATVTVAYSAGSVTQDDKRTVAVVFEEAKAPHVILVVRAKVRESVTCVPPNLEFVDLGKGKSSRTNFEIHNFSGHDWESVCLQPCTAWLAASSTPLEIDSTATDGPRQIWRVTVTADASLMSVGVHDGCINVTAEGTETLVRKVPVRANVISPVVAIPQQFFFGYVTVGRSRTRSIALRFSSDAVPNSQEDVSLQHDLAEQLQLEWSNTQGLSWQLDATITPKSTLQGVGHKVVISFSDPALPSLTVPVYALLEAR